jgi:hydroxymethylglutaryl-CoA lyase
VKTSERIHISECGPRDVAFLLREKISAEQKIDLIDGLSETGVQKIDCVAFTHPRLFPELADAEEVLAGIRKNENVIYVGLVPNEIGCRRSLQTSVNEIAVFVSASETLHRAVLGLELKESLNKVLPTILGVAAEDGKFARAGILAAFGCPYTGEVAPEKVVELVSRLSFMGARDITLVDTSGMANPKSVGSLIKILVDQRMDISFSVHFHNVRGIALANALAAYEAGIRSFDTSLGGLSGRTFWSAQFGLGYWNIPTEDLVYMFHEMGVPTGVNLDKLLTCVEKAEELIGCELPGHILRSERASKYHPHTDTVMLK